MLWRPALLWREEVQALHDSEYKDVELSHMLADNCAMQLLRNPKQFDVIVTDNLFGDMLSDQASMLTGSLGLLPSASLGAKNKDGEMRAMYEPIHGSAPDIAGKGIANPIASILSFAMALRYSLDLDNEADSLEKAVQDVLNDGLELKIFYQRAKKKSQLLKWVMLLFRNCNNLLINLNYSNAKLYCTSRRYDVSF